MNVIQIGRRGEKETPAPAPTPTPLKLKDAEETEYEKRKRETTERLRTYGQPRNVGVVISDEELSRI